MRLVHDTSSYEGGIDLTDGDKPGGGLGFRASNGVLTIEIRGGGGPLTLGGTGDLTRDQLLDFLTAGRLALEAHDVFWRDQRDAGA